MTASVACSLSTLSYSICRQSQSRAPFSQGLVSRPGLRSRERQRYGSTTDCQYRALQTACGSRGGSISSAPRLGAAGTPLWKWLRMRRAVLLQLSGGLLGTMFTGQAAGVSAKAATSVEEVLREAKWPEEWPFKPEDFSRFDEMSDTVFYSQPRFVTHIDDSAIAALTGFHGRVLPPAETPGVAVLDLCSSWISHYPKGYKQPRVVGLGMNGEELQRNEVLTEYVVQDLNTNPILPFEDNSFDVITNTVSVDYLVKPLEVFREIRRVLKPGGISVNSFSNRLFFTKAVSIWTATNDEDHAWIVGSYFHFAGGFEHPEAVDLSPRPGRSDPLYAVTARKLKA